MNWTDADERGRYDDPSKEPDRCETHDWAYGTYDFNGDDDAGVYWVETTAECIICDAHDEDVRLHAPPGFSETLQGRMEQEQTDDSIHAVTAEVAHADGLTAVVKIAVYHEGAHDPSYPEGEFVFEA